MTSVTVIQNGGDERRMVPEPGPPIDSEHVKLKSPAGSPLGTAKLHAIWAKLPLVLRRVWPALLVGVAIRLILAPISLNTDLMVFAQSSASMLYGQGPYSHPEVYPPFWVFYLNAVGRATALIVPGPLWFSTNTQLQSLYLASSTLTPEYALTTVYVVIEKSSLMLFDLGTAFLLYHIAVRQSGQTAAGVGVFALWFLNPYVIILSSVHGSYDVVPTFCALAAFVLALERLPLVSGLAIASAVLLGVFPIFLVPLLVVVVWKTLRISASGPWKSLLQFVGGLAVPTVAVLAAPDLISSYFSSALVGPSRGTGLYQGFGFWGVFSIPGLKGTDRWLSDLPGTWTLAAFAVVAFAIALVVAFHFLRTAHSESVTGRFWILAVTATTMGVFVIPETFQPQYVVWVLPFVALLTVGNRWFKIIYVLLSAVPALFYFVLAGPFLNFLPLWYNYHLVSFGEIDASVRFWVGIQDITFPAMFIPAFVTTVILAVLTFKELFKGRVSSAGAGGPRR